VDPIITRTLDFLVDDLFRGDSATLTVTVTRLGVIEDLTGAKVYFTAKADLADLDDDALMAYDTVAGGVTVSAPLTGVAVVTMSAADTALCPVDTPIFADVQVKTAAGEIFTAAFGQLIFRADVTQRIS
jgi:hypothetical protein